MAAALEVAVERRSSASHHVWHVLGVPAGVPLSWFLENSNISSILD